jgi:hypothetical protein
MLLFVSDQLTRRTRTMLVRRIVLLVLATGVLWKCLTLLLAPLAPDESTNDLMKPTPVERAPPELRAARATMPDPRRVLRGQLLRSLEEQQVALDLCVPPRGNDRTLVGLELELLDGSARIADVDVITEEPPDPALVACLQAALRERTLTATSAKPTSKRTRVVFRLEDYL